MSGETEGPGREPQRSEVDGIEGPALLEFGASWCGHCRAIAPSVAALLGQHPRVRHIKVDDGPGRPLGRSFRVTLWPTFVFMRGGKVVKQVARPGVVEVRDGLRAIDPGE